MSATAVNAASPTTEPEPETPVIFRKWQGKDGGDIIAVFPAECASVQNWYLSNSYMHHGQHGACDYRIILAKTRPAKPEEYADLKLELERIGYRLKVCRMETSIHRAERERQWREFMKPRPEEKEQDNG